MLSKNLDLYCSKYENNFIPGDLNVGVSDPHIEDFYKMYNLSILIKELRCYTNLENLSCNELILTNWRSFQHPCIVETGLCSFHGIAVNLSKITSENNNLQELL